MTGQDNKNQNDIVIKRIESFILKKEGTSLKSVGNQPTSFLNIKSIWTNQGASNLFHPISTIPSRNNNQNLETTDISMNLDQNSQEEDKESEPESN
jgi:hypothetical protein